MTAGSDDAQAAAGATGTAAWALPIAEQWAAQTVAIRPAGGRWRTDQEGCAKALAEIIRKILEGIINAINNAFKKGSSAARRARPRRRSGGRSARATPRADRRLLDLEELTKALAALRVTQLGQCLRLDLADPLAGHAELLPTSSSVLA